MTKRNAPTGRGPRLRASVLAAGIGLAAIVTGPALADHNSETHPILAGSLISNTASVTYSVNDVPQDEVDSTTATFEVDRVIDVLVAGQTSPDVTPGADATLVYTVTNEGNETQAYDLSVYDATNFDGATQIWIDDGDGVFNPTLDTLYDPGTTGVYPELTPGQTMTVFVVGPTATTLTDGQVVDADLVAATLEPSTQPTWWDTDPAENGPFTPYASVQQSTTTANDVVDTIFIDDQAAGTVPPTTDEAGDAQHSDIAEATVATATLAVTKEVTVINSDGAACAVEATTVTANSFAIPGACVEYVITVTNSSTTPATNVVISDTLPDTVEVVLVYHDGDFTDEAGEDTAPTETAANVVSGTEDDLGGAESVQVYIRALIN